MAIASFIGTYKWDTKSDSARLYSNRQSSCSGSEKCV